MSQRFQRLLSLAAAAVLALPMSLLADSRTPQRTDLDQLAADLARVLGGDHVTVEGQRPSPPQESERLHLPPSRRISEEALVDSMNRERTAQSLPLLRIVPQLAAAAQDRAADMLREHYFAHVSPEGKQPWVWADREGYNYSAIAENLATGYPTAEAVVDGWMHSPGHRENLLGHYRDVGIAIVDASPARQFAGPLVVVLYGAR